MEKRGHLSDERKRRIRWLKIRRLLFLSACAVLLFSLIFGGISGYKRLAQMGREKKISQQLEKIKNAEMPDFIDTQLIDKGNARSGEELERVRDIVIHYVGNPGTSAQNNRNYFAKPDTLVCSHFVVGLEGEVIRCLPLNEKSAASNHRNRDTISIEVCHPDASGEFNEDTYNSLVRLTAWLCELCDLTEKDIIRHYDVTGKLCPIYYVEHEDEWESFKEDVRKKLKE